MQLVGFRGIFILERLNRPAIATPCCEPPPGETNVQNIPQGPVYAAGFTEYIKLDRARGLTDAPRTYGKKTMALIAFLLGIPMLLYGCVASVAGNSQDRATAATGITCGLLLVGLGIAKLMARHTKDGAPLDHTNDEQRHKSD